MSITIPIRRVDDGRGATSDWWAEVIVFDDPGYPATGAVHALMTVLAIDLERALWLMHQIERHGQYPVWEGTREGAEHNARRLIDHGLRARVT